MSYVTLDPEGVISKGYLDLGVGVGGLTWSTPAISGFVCSFSGRRLMTGCL